MHLYCCVFIMLNLFFSLLVFSYWKVNFSVVNFLTMVLLLALHFVKHQEIFSDFFFFKKDLSK